MDVVTAVLIAGIQTQRTKLQRTFKRYTRLSVNAFKRWDLERGLKYGAKALAAKTADQVLADQQNKLRARAGSNR